MVSPSLLSGCAVVTAAALVVYVRSFAPPASARSPGRPQTPLSPSLAAPPAAATYGAGLDQDDLMSHDLCIAVDGSDGVVGRVSKREAHAWGPDAPRGVLHRAFSVFLFDGAGRMLLTRRSADKITFPGVWTNACCSHPLHGRSPSEVDDPVSDYPEFPGTKAGAVRKLAHELGIREGEVPPAALRFLRRFHYWAADTVTYGSSPPWGEHEVDYIFFAQCAGAGPELAPDPAEVAEWRYVTRDELRGLLADDGNGMLWSPWFRGILERGGFAWWEDLEAAVGEGSPYCADAIHYFDAPPEHRAEYNLLTHDRQTGVWVAQRAPPVPQGAAVTAQPTSP